MNMFIWAGIALVSALIMTYVSIKLIVDVDACWTLSLEVLTLILAAVLWVALIAFIAIGCAGIYHEENIDFYKEKAATKREQYVMYAESEEITPALEEEYFDKIMSFNENIYMYQKYNGKFMLKYLIWEPEYEGLEPIDMHGRNDDVGHGVHPD